MIGRVPGSADHRPHGATPRSLSTVLGPLAGAVVPERQESQAGSSRPAGEAGHPRSTGERGSQDWERSSGSDIERGYVSSVAAGSHEFTCGTNNNRPCGGARGYFCKKAADKAVAVVASEDHFTALAAARTALRRPAALLDGFAAELAASCPGSALERIQARRWTDLWSRGCCWTAIPAMPPLPGASLVSPRRGGRAR